MLLRTRGRTLNSVTGGKEAQSAQVLAIVAVPPALHSLSALHVREPSSRFFFGLQCLPSVCATRRWGAGKPVSQQEWQKALQLAPQTDASPTASADGSEQSWHHVWQLSPTSGSSPPPGISPPSTCFSAERLTQGPYTLSRISMVG